LRAFSAVLTAALVLAVAWAALALDGRSVVRLKKAGVGDRALELIARERTVETGAFTVEEIIAMKSAGLGEAALQALVVQGSFLRDRQPILYGSDIKPLRFATAADIIALKNAGIGDEVLQAVAALGRAESQADREQALGLLRDMGIWVEFKH
jgi:hypothetical protein